MKQLLIVSNNTLNGGLTASGAKANDLTSLTEGAIGLFKVADNSMITATPTENFGIALGGGSNKPAFVIPEVDVNTLTVTKAGYVAGVNFSASVVIPAGAAEKVYTLVLVKLGTGINGERNKWSQSVAVPKGSTMTAADLADKLKEGFAKLADNGTINATFAVVTANNVTRITVDGQNPEDKWRLVPSDDLYGAAVLSKAGTANSSPTQATPACGDAAYVKKLARECAGNKGFTNTDGGSELYPGYPESVDAASYNIYTLRFATKRDAGKQTDERIWQYVHIAVPTSYTALNTSLTSILVSSVLPNAAAAAQSSGT